MDKQQQIGNGWSFGVFALATRQIETSRHAERAMGPRKEKSLYPAGAGA